MARINKSDIMRTITRGNEKDIYVFKIVVDRFIEEMKRQLRNGNVVAVKGLGTFYIDDKKKWEERQTLGIKTGVHPDLPSGKQNWRFNPDIVHYKFIAHGNLKGYTPHSVQAGRPRFATQRMRDISGSLYRGNALYPFAVFKKLKYVASGILTDGLARKVVRFKSSALMDSRGLYWSGFGAGDNFAVYPPQVWDGTGWVDDKD